MIRVTNLCFSYARDRPLLRNLNFTVPQGALAAVTGENGAGKSTLIRLLYGEIRPQSGSVEKCEDRSQPVEAFVDQDPANCIWPELTVKAHLVISLNRAKWYGHVNSREHQQEVEAFTRATLPDLSEHLTSEAGRLSRGQMQLLALCMAIARRPHHLYLDEIAASLSVENQNRAWNLIANYHKQSGATVLFVSHTPEEVRRLATLEVHLTSQNAHIRQLRATGSMRPCEYFVQENTES